MISSISMFVAGYFLGWITTEKPQWAKDAWYALKNKLNT